MVWEWLELEFLPIEIVSERMPEPSIHFFRYTACIIICSFSMIIFITLLDHFHEFFFLTSAVLPYK